MLHKKAITAMRHAITPHPRQIKREAIMHCLRILTMESQAAFNYFCKEHSFVLADAHIKETDSLGGAQRKAEAYIAAHIIPAQ